MESEHLSGRDKDTWDWLVSRETKIKFWVCPHCVGSVVTWSGDVATCEYCGCNSMKDQTCKSCEGEWVLGNIGLPADPSRRFLCEDCADRPLGFEGLRSMTDQCHTFRPDQ
jgi:hypothetical protein